jgi:hypothetical protein
MRTIRRVPWGFRRSLKLVGPLRLNLSKSGLGLSLGVPGLHIGSGPRGRYVRAGLPGTGIYYRKSLNKPAPVHVRAPTKTEQETGWMRAVHALLSGDPKACLSILDSGPIGGGPAVHIEVDADVVVTLLPDECGIAVLRAEALDRIGDHAAALALVEQAAKNGCHVAEVVATELRTARH